MPRIPIGPILDIVRNLPPLRPPVVHGPDPFDDFDIPDIPFDDDFERAPPRLPQEVHDPPLHEPPPQNRPSTGNLLDESPGLSQAQPPPQAPPSAPSTPSAEQLLDESPGLNQTQPPPSLSDLQDLINQNNQVADQVLHGNPGEGTQVAGGGLALLGLAVAGVVVVFFTLHEIKRGQRDRKDRESEGTGKTPLQLEQERRQQIRDAIDGA